MRDWTKMRSGARWGSAATGREGVVRVNRRLAVAVACAAFVMLALPATASAHVSTKIVTAYQVVADNSVAGREATPPVLTANLVRRSHGKWVALRATVRCYLVGDGGVRTLVAEDYGNRVAFNLPERGTYLLVYKGSRSYKSARAYSKRVDRIGAVAAEPEMSVTAGPGATYWTVEVDYPVTWNTEAYDGPVSFMYIGAFTTNPDADPLLSSAVTGSAIHMCTLDEPGSVHLAYRVPASQAVGSFVTMGWPAVGSSSAFIVDDPMPDEPFILRR